MNNYQTTALLEILGTIVKQGFQHDILKAVENLPEITG